MRGGMLRSEVHSIVADFAIFDYFAVFGGYVHVLRLVRVDGMAESFVDWDQTSAFAYWLGEMPSGCCGKASFEGARYRPGGSEAKTSGGVGSEAEKRGSHYA